LELVHIGYISWFYILISWKTILEYRNSIHFLLDRVLGTTGTQGRKSKVRFDCGVEFFFPEFLSLLRWGSCHLGTIMEIETDLWSVGNRILTTTSTTYLPKFIYFYFYFSLPFWYGLYQYWGILGAWFT